MATSVADIIARRQGENSDATILHEIVVLTKTIKLMDKLCYSVPVIAFKELKADNRLRPAKKRLRYLSVEEEQQLFVALDPSKTKNDEVKQERTEMRDLVIVLIDTGARYGVFPRITLEKAVGYAKRLVSKTHTGPQPRDIILSGVLDTKGGEGSVRLSALKQYGFAKGDNDVGFEASDEAKAINSAPPDELVRHYRTAVLRPTIFKALFDTFHGDKVSSAKLKQRAAALNVHPDETETCVANYLAAVQLAALVTVQGDDYAHVSQAELAAGHQPAPKNEETPTEETPDVEEVPEAKPPEGGQSAGAGIQVPTTATETKNSDPAAQRQDLNASTPSTPRAVFNVNVSLDSSLDTEKLEKQLALLKRYGAI